MDAEYFSGGFNIDKDFSDFEDVPISEDSDAWNSNCNGLTASDGRVKLSPYKVYLINACVNYSEFEGEKYQSFSLRTNEDWYSNSSFGIGKSRYGGFNESNSSVTKIIRTGHMPLELYIAKDPDSSFSKGDNIRMSGSITICEIK